MLNTFCSVLVVIILLMNP